MLKYSAAVSLLFPLFLLFPAPRQPMAAPRVAMPRVVPAPKPAVVPAPVPVPAPAAVAPARPAADSAAARGQKYWLHLYALHTGERLNVVYRVGNRYVPGAVARIDYLLRDWRTDTVKDYSLRELNLLHALMVRLGRPDGVIDIVCGYRTPATNTFLRDTTAGVAMHSEHIQAKAIDIRVPGVPLARLRATALALHRGGVGYYPESDFVHVDVGPVRYW